MIRYKAASLVCCMLVVLSTLGVRSASTQSLDQTLFGPTLPGFSRPPLHLEGGPTAAPSGYTPQQVRQAYGFDQIANQGAGQTIGIVDAFDAPKIESDLATFNTQFGLPACTTANGCFEKVFAAGTKPAPNRGWAGEISLDVEWAHAIAPAAKILLVEARSNSNVDLFNAVDVAVQHGASVVSLSWGGGESASELSLDSHFMVSNVTFTVSSGDSGTGAQYPAASPFVVAVGGTALNLNGGAYVSETAWSGSGGGRSSFEVQPAYQANYPIPSNPNGKRGIPDVSYDGAPSTGFPVFTSMFDTSSWGKFGGTSAGAPQWAALFAIANSVRAAGGKSPLNNTPAILYNTAIGKTGYATNYHDVTSGTNGACGAPVCTAVAGYDYVTGLGSPQGNNIITALAAEP
jgi:subtilase family serine protease